MTPYTPKDLAEGWEFKILRSTTGGFRNPEWMRSVLEEEERAGWTLLEKFDDARIRLKRPAGARAGDAALDFDPMRTWVGVKPNVFALAIVGLVFAIAAASAVVIYVLASR